MKRHAPSSSSPSSNFLQSALLALLGLCFVPYTAANPLLPRGNNNDSTVEGDGWVNPITHGGSMLTIVTPTYPPGLGEPINVIISGHSDKGVLGDAMIYYFGALGFSENCLGAVPENQQKANLGDGQGAHNQSTIQRWNYGDFNFGSCQETVHGGNHFRLWQQTGSDANTGALFLATSVEQPLAQNHDIQTPDGYDAGRDQLRGNATQEGGISFQGYTFETTSKNITGLLESGSDGINHGLSIDGVVYEFTVKITGSPEGVDVTGDGLSSGAPGIAPAAAWPTSALAMVLVTLSGAGVGSLFLASL